MALFQYWVRRLQAKKLPGENDLLWPSAGSKSILAGKQKRPGSLPALTLLSLAAIPGHPRHREFEPRLLGPASSFATSAKGLFHRPERLDPFGGALKEALFGKSIKRPKSLFT
jgi:hypothetical protein